MGGLADEVLPLIRTRADVWRWSTANHHGAQMHDAVAVLQAAAVTEDPAVVYAVTTKAIASAMTVIMRADDSSGIIGDACTALLDLHPAAAARARPPAAKLVEWMLRFQFHNPCDFFTLDPVAYAPALGTTGVATYRTRLAEHAASLGPRPTPEQALDLGGSAQRHDWFTLDHNARRLAVLDRDVDAVIATHARDRKVARWYHDTAVALAEIDQLDHAVDWARRALDVGPPHQASSAGEYWCTLLAEHHPDQLLAARLEVFRRWPNSATAAHLHRDAGAAWPELRDDVMQRLAASPRDAVLFAQLTLADTPYAWQLAHTLGLDDDRTWHDLATAYATIDPAAVLPVLHRLVEQELTRTGAQHYRTAARILTRMRTLAATTDQPAEHGAAVDHLIAELRETHRRRPRLHREFDRVGLP